MQASEVAAKPALTAIAANKNISRFIIHLFLCFMKRLIAIYLPKRLELEAVFESSCLVEYEVVSCAVRILEEVSYALELNCDT